jgi:hypothetical protein
MFVKQQQQPWNQQVWGHAAAAVDGGSRISNPVGAHNLIHDVSTAEPEGKGMGRLASLGVLFVGWYATNIYFNM